MTHENHDFNRNVFINCPFDPDYKPMLRALLLTVIECGLEPRIATESGDSGEVRVQKIENLIRESRYSIHDISRIEPLTEGDLPRFNMPFELGLDLGCRDFGNGQLSEKKCLILEKEQYRSQKVLSDISGNDIKAHKSEPQTLVRQIRNWVYETTNRRGLLSGTRLWQRLNEFYAHFETAMKELNFGTADIEEMPDMEFIELITDWIKSNPSAL